MAVTQVCEHDSDVRLVRTVARAVPSGRSLPSSEEGAQEGAGGIILKESI